MPDRTSRLPFSGRADELAFLREQLARARQGAGGVVLLAGEPGIDKARLAEEVAAEAEAGGGRVLWGRCHEGDGAPSYWPWVRKPGRGRATVAPRPRAPRWGRVAEEIARMIAEVRTSQAGRSRAGRGAASAGPLPPVRRHHQVPPRGGRRAAPVVVLDDLHPGRYTLAAAVAVPRAGGRRLRLLVLGTYRDIAVGRDHPLTRAMVDLAREATTSRLHLPGLAAREVARIVAISRLRDQRRARRGHRRADRRQSVPRDPARPPRGRRRPRAAGRWR